MKLPLILTSLAIVLTASACSEQDDDISEAPKSTGMGVKAGTASSMTSEIKLIPQTLTWLPKLTCTIR